MGFTSHRAAIAPFLAMEVVREAEALTAQGRSIARFDVGQPFGAAPATARAAATAAIATEGLGYTTTQGDPALRARISAWYAERHGVDVDPDRIVITTGASGGFVVAFLALLDTGDRVALAAPGYPPYRHILTALGYQPAVIDAGEADRWQLTAAHVETLAQAGPLKAVLAASPANPTGTVLSRAELTALHDASKAAGASLIVDEIYHGLTYGADCPSILEITQDAIVVSSFSKYFAMTGWRIGWVVLPPDLVRPVERLAGNLFLCAPAVSQVGARAAFDATEELDARRAAYAANREVLLARLAAMGVTRTAPADGAFYVYADVSAFTDDSLAWCARALHEADVALIAGGDFDERRGARWVRLAYARDAAEIAAGLDRLEAWIGAQR